MAEDDVLAMVWGRTQSTVSGSGWEPLPTEGGAWLRPGDEGFLNSTDFPRFGDLTC